MGVFYRANGECFFLQLSQEDMERIGTWANLKEMLIKKHGTDDVVIDGRGEA